MTHDSRKPSTKVPHEPADARHHRYTNRGQPNVPHHDHAGLPGTAVCPSCHAIWEHKHWTYDDTRYRRMATNPEVPTVICEGCERVARGEFDGEVVLTSPLIPPNRQSILALISHTERHIRQQNPLARIASLTVEGETIRLLTVTTFLAERIGKELEKAYGGKLELNHPEREHFVRVRWERAR